MAGYAASFFSRTAVLRQHEAQREPSKTPFLKRIVLISTQDLGGCRRGDESTSAMLLELDRRTQRAWFPYFFYFFDRRRGIRGTPGRTERPRRRARRFPGCTRSTMARHCSCRFLHRLERRGFGEVQQHEVHWPFEPEQRDVRSQVLRGLGCREPTLETFVIRSDRLRPRLAFASAARTAWPTVRRVDVAVAESYRRGYRRHAGVTLVLARAQRHRWHREVGSQQHG